MTFIIGTVYIIITILIWLGIKDRISRLLSLTYVSYWCISLLLCAINPFGYFDVSDGTYILLLGHVITFMMGFALVNPKISPNIYNMVHFYSIKKLVKNKLFLMLYLICLAFITVLFYRQRVLFAIYNLVDMRGDFMSMILEDSGLAYLFYEIIGVGMFLFTLSLLSYMIMFERRWFYIVIIFIYDAIWAIVSGGRAQVMTLGFYLLSTFFLSDYIQSVKNGRDSKYKLSRRTKTLIPFFVVGLTIAMTIVTAMKHSTEKIDAKAFEEALSDLGMDFGEYSAGPVVAFDQGIKDSEIEPKEYQYGAATFCGADYFLYIALRRYGIHETSSYNLTTHVFQEASMKLSQERGWNYAYTSCMYYYHDLGILGVLLIPFILGFITRRIIARLYVSVDIYNVSLFTFTCFCLYMSVFSGYTHKMVVPFFVITMMALSFFTKHHQKKIGKRHIIRNTNYLA